MSEVTGVGLTAYFPPINIMSHKQVAALGCARRANTSAGSRRNLPSSYRTTTNSNRNTRNVNGILPSKSSLASGGSGSTPGAEEMTPPAAAEAVAGVTEAGGGGGVRKRRPLFGRRSRGGTMALGQSAQEQQPPGATAAAAAGGGVGMGVAMRTARGQRLRAVNWVKQVSAL